MIFVIVPNEDVPLLAATFSDWVADEDDELQLVAWTSCGLLVGKFTKFIFVVTVFHHWRILLKDVSGHCVEHKYNPRL